MLHWSAQTKTHSIPLLLLALLAQTLEAMAWLRGGKDDRGARTVAGEKQESLGDGKVSAEIEGELQSKAS